MRNAQRIEKKTRRFSVCLFFVFLLFQMQNIDIEHCFALSPLGECVYRNYNIPNTEYGMSEWSR